MTKFSKVNIEISNVCNLKCSFCPEVMRASKLMDVELFKKIIPQLKGMTDQVTFHLMGDPLVHPELGSFVEICEQESMPVFLVTNGVLLREKQKKILESKVFRQINFSLHSFFDNFPERDPAPYLEKIFEFTDQALKERPDVYLNFRLWNLEVPNRSTSRNLEMLKRIQARYPFRFPEHLDVRKDKSIRIQGRLYLHLDTEFVWPSPTAPWIGETGTCRALQNHFGILADGTVVPCCLDSEGRIPLGSVAEKPIREILEGEEAQKILNGFLQKKLVNEMCQRCDYARRFKSVRPVRESSVPLSRSLG